MPPNYTAQRYSSTSWAIFWLHPLISHLGHCSTAATGVTSDVTSQPERGWGARRWVARQRRRWVRQGKRQLWGKVGRWQAIGSRSVGSPVDPTHAGLLPVWGVTTLLLQVLLFPPLCARPALTALHTTLLKTFFIKKSDIASYGPVPLSNKEQLKFTFSVAVTEFE